MDLSAAAMPTPTVVEPVADAVATPAATPTPVADAADATVGVTTPAAAAAADAAEDKPAAKADEDEDEDESSSEEEEEEEEEAPAPKATASKRTDGRTARVRKQVTHFVAAAPVVAKEKVLNVPAGTGTAFGDIENVEHRLRITKADDPLLITVHKMLFPGYGRPRKADVKGNLRQFHGWPEAGTADGDAAREACEEVLEDLTVATLKTVAQLCDTAVSGAKSDMVEQLLTWLASPTESGNAFQFKGKRKRAASSSSSKGKGKKGKKRKAGSKKKRAPSSYILFTSSIRERVNEENPSLSMTEKSKVMGSMWRELSEEQKAKWAAKSKALQAELDSGDGGGGGDTSEATESEVEDDEESSDDDDEPLANLLDVKPKLAAAIEKIVNEADLTQLSMKAVRVQLAGTFGEACVKQHKPFIKATVTAAVAATD